MRFTHLLLIGADSSMRILPVLDGRQRDVRGRASLIDESACVIGLAPEGPVILKHR